MTQALEICVMIPVWKDQTGLDTTLAALAQDETPFDIMIVDDGSPTPITAPAKVGSHGITLIRLPENRGIEHALNTGIAEIIAKGYTYISRLDCADTPMAGRLERQLEHMRKHPDIGILGHLGALRQ